MSPTDPREPVPERPDPVRPGPIGRLAAALYAATPRHPLTRRRFPVATAVWMLSRANERGNEPRPRGHSRASAFSGRLRWLVRLSSFRFLLVAGVSLGVDAGMLFVLHGLLGVVLPVATATSFVVSFAVNFALNHRWAFGSTRGPVGRRLTRYLMLVAANLGATVMIVQALVALTLPYLVAKVLCNCVLFVVNYVVSRKWIYNEADCGERGMRVAERRLGLWAFLGFFLVIGSWSIAGPYNGTMDEGAHTVRAAGAASGQWVGQRTPVSGAYQTAPGEYSVLACWLHGKSAACAPLLQPQPRVRTATTAGRYFPVYYTVVGWPLNVFGGWPGLILARLISAALSAGFLAAAFAVLARWSRYGLMVAGLAVAASPMVIEVGGFINPNGLEMAAGIAFFAAGIPLLLGPPRGRVTPLAVLLAISGAMLATLKATGPLWLGIIVLVLLVPMRLVTVRQLLRRRSVRLSLAGITAAMLVSAVWTFVTRADQIVPIHHPTRLSLGQAMLMELGRWVQWDGGYLVQIVGLMSWLDTRIFEPAYPVWWFTAAALILPAFAFGRWLDRWRLAALIAGSVGVPFILQVTQANTMGFVTQARYFLPILAGVPMLAAFILERRSFTAAQVRSFTRMTILLLLPIQLIALVYGMSSWQHGLPKIMGPAHLNPLTGDWHPWLGSIAPLVTMVLGLMVIGYLAWHVPDRAAHLPDEPAVAPASATAGDPPAERRPDRLDEADRNTPSCIPSSAW